MLKQKRIIFLFGLIISVFVSFSQSPKKNKASKKILKDAQYYFDNENYETSWKLYKKVLLIDKVNELAAVNGAICAFKLNYVLDSLIPLIPILTQSSLIDSKYYLAKIKHQQHLFNEAIVLLEAYSQTPYRERLHNNEETTYLISCCINARNNISNPHKAIIRNMGKNINSVFSDYVPVIMPDESAMYFTSKREGSSNNNKNSDNTYFEDVYVSYNENGIWTKAENIGAPINTETNDACVAISPNGQKMIVYRTAADQISGDLYQTRLGVNNKWEALELMSYEINSPYLESSACFSNDTSEIFFSSNRPGGFGGKDLYRIKKLPNGLWSPPLNLGPTVNTKYDEDSPYLHPDGVSLYFSSKGHNTMGEYDVFKSVWDHENVHFSQAENLGYPVNDVGNDIFFILSENGQRGYYSSAKTDSYGGIDIYQIDTRFRENEIRVEEGYTFIEGKPCKAKISLKEKDTEQIIGIYFSNPTSGRFIIILNPSKNYIAILEAEECETVEVEIKPLEMEANSHYLNFNFNKSNAQ